MFNKNLNVRIVIKLDVKLSLCVNILPEHDLIQVKWLYMED